MRKLLTILLLAFLPLQFSWAAVASYCEHEVGVSSEHFGHHEHKHTDTVLLAIDEKTLTESSLWDADCASCHTCSSLLMLNSSPSALNALTNQSASQTLQKPRSAPVLRPERPKWNSLAF